MGYAVICPECRGQRAIMMASCEPEVCPECEGTGHVQYEFNHERNQD